MTSAIGSPVMTRNAAAAAMLQWAPWLHQVAALATGHPVTGQRLWNFSLRLGAMPSNCITQMSSRGLAGKRGKWEMRDPLCCKLKDSWTKLNNLETLFTRDFHKFTSKGWIDSFNFDQFLPYFFHQQEPNEYAWSSSWCLLVLVVESHQVILCPSQLILDQ